MRALLGVGLRLGLLVATASCAPLVEGPLVEAPPAATMPPPGPIVLAAPSSTVVEVAPSTPVVVAPPPAMVEAGPAPVFPGFTLPFAPRPIPARLTLSNFSFDRARVMAITTASRDCNVRVEGDSEINFDLPLNATRIIDAPPGSDVCWSREIEPAQGGGMRRWSAWNRVYLSVAGPSDSRL